MNRYTRLLYLTAILNLADAVITIIAVKAGWAKEANPFMAFFINHSTESFLFVKMFIVTLGLALLYALLPHKGAVRALYIVAGAYTVLMAYTVTALTMFLV